MAVRHGVLVPMTRATGMGPLPELLERMEGMRAVQCAFAAEALPLQLIENRNISIPLGALVGLFERAGRAAGDRRFGVRVGDAMPPSSFGLWLEYSATAPNLQQAIHRAQRTTVFHQPGARMTFDQTGEHALWRCQLAFIDRTSHQHADHILLAMMRFVATFLGRAWKPDWVELTYARDPAAGDIERELQVPIVFGRDAIGVAIRLSDMICGRSPALAARQSRHITLADVEAAAAKEACPEPFRSIRSIVALRLLDSRSDIDGAAAMAGVSVQRLQRTLQRDGLTYRDIVAMARRDRASDLLRETDASVADVAFALGYSDHANFTRAFKRWTGQSPLAFRSNYAGACRTVRLPAAIGM